MAGRSLDVLYWAIEMASAAPLQRCAVYCVQAEWRDTLFNRAVEIGGSLLHSVDRQNYIVTLPNFSTVEFIYSPFVCGIDFKTVEIDGKPIDMEHTGTREGK